jgi:hypothetical protein
MPEPCFLKKGLKPPLCAVHKAALVPKQIAIDANAPGLGYITCHVCPVSQAVVREPREPHA